MFIIFECVDLTISPFHSWLPFLFLDSALVFFHRVSLKLAVFIFFLLFFNIFNFIKYYNVSHMYDKHCCYLLNIKIRTNENSPRLKQLNKLKPHSYTFQPNNTNNNNEKVNWFRSCLLFSYFMLYILLSWLCSVPMSGPKEYVIENN